MATLLKTILRVQSSSAHRALDKAAERPADSQREFLLRVLRQNNDTDYGRAHGFSSIRDEVDFRTRVPIVQYTQLEPYISKLRKGINNVLTREPAVMFALTSGTTDKPKYIPITATGMDRTVKLMGQWFCRALTDHPSLLDASFAGITGAAVEGRAESGIPCGSASGMIYTTLPWIIRRTFAIPAQISAVADYDLRYYLIARFAYSKAVSFIATPNPLTLVRIAEAAMHDQEGLIRSIHNGWVSEKLRTVENCMAAGVPVSLLAVVKPNPRRARFLTEVLGRTGKLTPMDCWPELKLIGCWLGGSIGFQTCAIEDYYGKIPKRDIGYMASEGCITLPYQNSTAAGIPALQSAYYEFIPEEQFESDSPDVLPAVDVQIGRCYKLLLTNENGLYRYDINDIVKVEGRYRNSPVISFVRKASGLLDIAGEKLHLNHFLFALQKLEPNRSVRVRQFRVVPDRRKLRYDLFLDISPEIGPDRVRTEVLPAIDAYLSECNIEYTSRRKSKRLYAPRIHVMKEGWEESIRKQHICAGKRDIQYKWLHLLQEPIVEDCNHIRYTVEAV